MLDKEMRAQGIDVQEGRCRIFLSSLPRDHDRQGTQHPLQDERAPPPLLLLLLYHDIMMFASKEHASDERAPPPPPLAVAFIS